MHSIIRRLILAAALLAGLVPVMAQVPPPVPGLPDTERRTSYSISASTCSCSVGFALFGDGVDYQNWIEVFVNGVQVQYNDPVLGWTVTSPTGPLATIARPVTDAVLTFSTAQTATIQIVGARRPRRVSQFSEGAGVSARNLNQVLTDVVAMLREVWDKINDVTGRVVRAPAGETMTTLPPAATRANQGVCFDGSGNIVACSITSSGAIAAGNGISLTGTNPKTITNNITGSGPIVIGGTNPLSIGCPTCSTFTPPTSTNAFVSTRAAATALNLSSFNVIQTGGYATAGDGGGATFQNVGSASFIDVGVTTGSITTPGSGYTNGTYLSVNLVGGHCVGNQLTAVVVVAGGVVTSVTPSGTGGNNCAVGDVLSALAGGLPAGSGFTWTVSTITTPTGSFVDSAGTHWQIVTNNGPPNVLQFGAVGNWTAAGGDAGATDSTAAFKNALRFANYGNGSLSAGGYNGGKVLVPRGGYLLCDGVTVPGQVILQGMGIGSLLKQCDAAAATSHFITLCDPVVHTACFGPEIKDLQLWPGSSTPNAGVAMIYTNSAQQLREIDNVTVYTGKRECLITDTGYGGASSFTAVNLFCTLNTASVSALGISLGYSSAVTTLRDLIVEVGTMTGSAIIITTGGVNVIEGAHFEGITSPIIVNVPGANTITNIHNITGGNNCTSLITRQGGSATNQLNVGALYPNGCTNSINNAGTPTTGLVVSDVKL